MRQQMIKLLETMTRNTYSVFLQYYARTTSNYYKLLSIILVSGNTLHDSIFHATMEISQGFIPTK